jgi:hypothetical protein
MHAWLLHALLLCFIATLDVCVVHHDWGPGSLTHWAVMHSTAPFKTEQVAMLVHVLLAAKQRMAG